MVEMGVFSVLRKFANFLVSPGSIDPDSDTLEKGKA
jgi:hypothetical protein